MPKDFYNVNLNFSYPGWHQCQVSKALESDLKFCLFFLNYYCEATVSIIEWLTSVTFWGFRLPYLGETWSQPLCEWKQISALSLHRPRSRKIQYLAYLRDQNLALWGRWHGHGTRRVQGHGAAACWPIDTPAPSCAMGCHALSGL